MLHLKFQKCDENFICQVSTREAPFAISSINLKSTPLTETLREKMRSQQFLYFPRQFNYKDKGQERSN